jgi:hypothetical protein
MATAALVGFDRAFIVATGCAEGAAAGSGAREHAVRDKIAILENTLRFRM